MSIHAATTEAPQLLNSLSRYCVMAYYFWPDLPTQVRMLFIEFTVTEMLMWIGNSVWPALLPDSPDKIAQGKIDMLFSAHNKFGGETISFKFPVKSIYRWTPNMAEHDQQIINWSSGQNHVKWNGIGDTMVTSAEH